MKKIFLLASLVCISLVSVFSGSVYAAQEKEPGKMPQYASEQKQIAEKEAQKSRKTLMEFRDQARQRIEDRTALFHRQRNWTMAWFAATGKGQQERDALVEELEIEYWRDMEDLMRDGLLWRPAGELQSRL